MSGLIWFSLHIAFESNWGALKKPGWNFNPQSAAHTAGIYQQGRQGSSVKAVMVESWSDMIACRMIEAWKLKLYMCVLCTRRAAYMLLFVLR